MSKQPPNNSIFSWINENMKYEIYEKAFTFTFTLCSLLQRGSITRKTHVDIQGTGI